MFKELLITTLTCSLVMAPSLSHYTAQNTANAKEEITGISSNTDEEAAYVIKDYVKLRKISGIYQYTVSTDPSMILRLKKINISLTSDEVHKYFSDLNNLLLKENGNGPITDAINEIKYYSKIKHGSYLKKCSTWYGASGLASSIGYGAWGVAFAASGPAGWTLLGAGSLVGAGFFVAAELC